MSDRRKILDDLKVRLIEALGDAEVRELAPIARELRATLAELEVMPAANGVVPPTDEIAARREERRKAASQ